MHFTKQISDMTFDEKINILMKFLFDDSSFEEAIELYETSKAKFMKEVIINITYIFNFHPFLSKDFSFLSLYNEKVRDVVTYRILVSSINCSFSSNYFDWDDHKFNPNDFDIDDVLKILIICSLPNYPLVQSETTEEFYSSRINVINNISNSNLNNLRLMGINLYKKVISGSKDGNVVIKSETNTYYLHDFILEPYPVFKNFLLFESSSIEDDCSENVEKKYEFKLPIIDDEAIRRYIAFLYYSEVTVDENVNEEMWMNLYMAADYTGVTNLTQICDIALKDKYNEECLPLYCKARLNLVINFTFNSGNKANNEAIIKEIINALNEKNNDLLHEKCKELEAANPGYLTSQDFIRSISDFGVLH